MPLRVTAFAIWQRLIEKFGIEDQGVDDPPPELGTLIVPIIDIVQVTKSYQAKEAVMDLRASAGTYLPGHTVPANHQWGLEMVQRDATTGTTKIIIKARGQEIPVTIEQTGSSIIFFSNLHLTDEDSIGLDTSGDMADQFIGLRLRYTDEVVRRVDAIP